MNTDEIQRLHQETVDACKAEVRDCLRQEIVLAVVFVVAFFVAGSILLQLIIDAENDPTQSYLHGFIPNQGRTLPPH